MTSVPHLTAGALHLNVVHSKVQVVMAQNVIDLSAVKWLLRFFIVFRSKQILRPLCRSWHVPVQLSDGIHELLSDLSEKRSNFRQEPQAKLSGWKPYFSALKAD